MTSDEKTVTARCFTGDFEVNKKNEHRQPNEDRPSTRPSYTISPEATITKEDVTSRKDQIMSSSNNIRGDSLLCAKSPVDIAQRSEPPLQGKLGTRDDALKEAEYCLTGSTTYYEKTSEGQERWKTTSHFMISA